jgi:hypothetical protein
MTSNLEQTGTGRFMITLCHLELPIHVRQPESPHLKPFTFFVGRTRQPDGSQQLGLHMGYFKTLVEAQTWVQRVRGRYPNAIATLAPEEFLRAPDAQPAAPAQRPGDVANGPLTDTQVMSILETRSAGQTRTDAADESNTQIPLVRPEDTTTRRVLQAAVAHGAPVSFAVQLQWSAQPIDLNGVPTHALFKGRLLYVAVSRREGRSSYFLRLGFFTDPISAKQVALQVRSKFTSAAVVPVTEDERLRARELRVDPPAAPTAERRPTSKPEATASAKSVGSGRRPPARHKETLDETLETLAQREMLSDPDATSESGVRHLKVEIQEPRPGRPRGP